MKHKMKIYLLASLCAFVYAVNAQNPIDYSLYERFDQSIGKNNTGINNGTVHINDLRSANNSHRYYMADKYSIGSIVYDGQPYNNIALKYDILKDVIIAKPEGEKSAIGINMITKKTSSFSLNGKKFTNPSYQNPDVPKFLSGFYEEDLISNRLIFYTKHIKDNIEVLRTEGVFYRFEPRNEYVFRYKNAYYRLSSSYDLRTVFPALEKNINEFYARNTALERSDKKLFYLTLLKQIETALPNESH